MKQRLRKRCKNNEPVIKKQYIIAPDGYIPNSVIRAKVRGDTNPPTETILPLQKRNIFSQGNLTSRLISDLLICEDSVASSAASTFFWESDPEDQCIGPRTKLPAGLAGPETPKELVQRTDDSESLKMAPTEVSEPVNLRLLDKTLIPDSQKTLVYERELLLEKSGILEKSINKAEQITEHKDHSQDLIGCRPASSEQLEKDAWKNPTEIERQQTREEGKQLDYEDRAIPQSGTEANNGNGEVAAAEGESINCDCQSSEPETLDLNSTSIQDRAKSSDAIPNIITISLDNNSNANGPNWVCNGRADMVVKNGNQETGSASIRHSGHLRITDEKMKQNFESMRIRQSTARFMPPSFSSSDKRKRGRLLPDNPAMYRMYKNRYQILNSLQFH